MLKQKENILQNLNTKIFTSNLIDVLIATIRKYWEIDTNIKLQAINNFKELREEKIISKIDFFLSVLKIPKHMPIKIRLGKDFIENFLNSTLSQNDNNFNLKNLTALEIKILNNYCEFLNKKLKDILIPVEEAKLSEKSEIAFNFLFYILDDKNQTSHLMLSIPSDRLNFEKLKTKISFIDEDFTSSQTQIKIAIGKTYLTLDELQNLSPDDIILLEDSNTSRLTLVSGELRQKFKVKPNPALIFNIDQSNNQENNNVSNNNEGIMNKNLWDDIQIEVNAEFEKVKMTIGEIKQITQGQIVDLGSVFDNKISLYVEDKKVAKGELLIINDRYAVRLDEVLSNGSQQKKEEIVATPANDEDEEFEDDIETENIDTNENNINDETNEENDEDEEFDYSDFEN